MEACGWGSAESPKVVHHLLQDHAINFHYKAPSVYINHLCLWCRLANDRHFMQTGLQVALTSWERCLFWKIAWKSARNADFWNMQLLGTRQSKKKGHCSYNFWETEQTEMQWIHWIEYIAFTCCSTWFFCSLWLRWKENALVNGTRRGLELALPPRAEFPNRSYLRAGWSSVPLLFPSWNAVPRSSAEHAAVVEARHKIWIFWSCIQNQTPLVQQM